MLTKAIALILLMFCSFGVTIFVLMKGWGLQAENWGIIIFGLIAQFIILILNTAITSDS